MAMLDPSRQRKWWMLALATLIMLVCAVLFGNAMRSGLEGLDLMEFVALKLTIPMGVGLLLLFFYLNKPAPKEE